MCATTCYCTTTGLWCLRHSRERHSNEFTWVIKELRDAVHEPLLLFGGLGSHMKSPRWSRVVQSVQASLFHGTERNGPKRLTISRNGTDDTVYCRAIQHNALTKYQVSNAFERSPRPSNSSTILLKKELPSSLPPVNPKVGKI